MAVCADFPCVIVVGPVFRAEDFDTHRHLCEFTFLAVEMHIKEHYFEVMDTVDRVFVKMFDQVNELCEEELKAIGRQYPFTRMKDARFEADPFGDLNTELERR